MCPGAGCAVPVLVAHLTERTLERNKTEVGRHAPVGLPYISCRAGRPKAGVELTPSRASCSPHPHRLEPLLRTIAGWPGQPLCIVARHGGVHPAARGSFRRSFRRASSKTWPHSATAWQGSCRRAGGRATRATRWLCRQHPRSETPCPPLRGHCARATPAGRLASRGCWRADRDGDLAEELGNPSGAGPRHSALPPRTRRPERLHCRHARFRIAAHDREVHAHRPEQEIACIRGWSAPVQLKLWKERAAGLHGTLLAA